MVCFANFSSPARNRALDMKQKELFDELQEDQGEFIEECRKAKEEGKKIDTDTLEALKERYKGILSICDEKVGVTTESYELLDRTILKLDLDLRKFEVELEQKELTLTAAERRKRKASSGVSAAEQRKMFASAESFSRDTRGRKKTGTSVARTFDVSLDMPIDPNEPTYCICNRVSFGEMVGCDNPDCKHEWFHYECVGLTSTPKGKWLCPQCIVLKRKE